VAPRPGDRVQWPTQTSGVEWTVVDIDAARAQASLVGVPFDIEKRWTVPLAELKPLDVPMPGSLHPTS
jgi:hypothetical protein